jgi:hypothetical protein
MKKRSVGEQIFRFFSSYALACVVLLLLTLVTFVGTVEQARIGLFHAQARYFESWFTTWPVALGRGELHIPLPGGMLLMAVLAVNMTLGFGKRLMKMPKGTQKIVERSFLLVCHGSILVMMLGGIWSLLQTVDGILQLEEGQTGDEFVAYHSRVLEVRRADHEGADPTTWVIRDENFKDLVKVGETRTFRQPEWPFEIVLKGYQPNSRTDFKPDEERRFRLLEQPYNFENAEANLAAMEIDVRPIGGGGGVEQKGVVAEVLSVPFTARFGEEAYAFRLGRERHRLPFAVRAEELISVNYPGTRKAAEYTSVVTKLKDGIDEQRIITMNEPLRDSGYAVFQSQMGDHQGSDGQTIRVTGLSIMKNPTDHWPLVICIIIGVALTGYFVTKLFGYLARG